MANAEGDDDVEDAEPQDVDNEAREMNDCGGAPIAFHILAPNSKDYNVYREQWMTINPRHEWETRSP